MNTPPTPEDLLPGHIEALKAFAEKRPGVEYAWWYGDKWVLSVEHHIVIGDRPAPNFFRIKPATEIVPFTFEDAARLRGEWVTSKDRGYQVMITGVFQRTVQLSDTFYGYDYLLNYYTFLDGSPCGKERKP